MQCVRCVCAAMPLLRSTSPRLQVSVRPMSPQYAHPPSNSLRCSRCLCDNVAHMNTSRRSSTTMSRRCSVRVGSDAVSCASPAQSRAPPSSFFSGPVFTTPRAHYSSTACGTRGDDGGGGGGGSPDDGASRKASAGNQAESPLLQEPYPIVQLPARSLWQPQRPLPPGSIASDEVREMVQRVQRARRYFQYPSLCAPQIGWNVHMFTLFDNSVYINARNLDAERWAEEATQHRCSAAEYEEVKMSQLRHAGETGFAWEPCASCCFLLHYIERPRSVRLAAYNADGEAVRVTLTGMRARMALHELDHMQGILFTRRVVDTDHAVPIAGFNVMSRWSDDFPSLEARSTFLYTVFTPPYSFATEAIDDANLLDRHFEDGVYPGSVRDRAEAVVSRAETRAAQQRWRGEKRWGESEEGRITMTEAKQSSVAEEEAMERTTHGEKVGGRE